MGAEDHIGWSAGRPLAWGDFAAEPNPSAYEDSHSHITYGRTWTVDSEEDGGRILFSVRNVRLMARFHPALSWVRATHATGALLAHEQRHFDLAELLRREQEPAVAAALAGRFEAEGRSDEQRRQFARESSGTMLAREAARLEGLLSARRAEYDEQSGYGARMLPGLGAKLGSLRGGGAGRDP